MNFLVTFVAALVCENYFVVEHCIEDFKNCVGTEVIWQEGNQVAAINHCIEDFKDVSQYEKTK